MTGFEWQKYIEIEDAPDVFKVMDLLSDDDVKNIKTEQDIVDTIYFASIDYPEKYKEIIRELKEEWNNLL